MLAIVVSLRCYFDLRIIIPGNISIGIYDLRIIILTENIRTSDDRTISQADGDAVGTSRRFRCPQSQLTSYILKGTKV
jgi:hypothetical protein